MTTVKTSREIGMPVVYVFRQFTDVEHSPAAVSAIKKIEMLTPGGMRLGVRWRETRQVFGRLDDANADGALVSGDVTLDELRATFPGF